MNRREENSDSIPIDLIIDIFSRLPAKSVARCRCLSKLWGSMLRRPYFTELFLTRSWARPRLLLAIKKVGKRSYYHEWSFYSSLQPHNPYEKSSPVLVANTAFHMKFPEDMLPEFRGFTSGLIYFSSMRISNKSEDEVPVIFNPRTGQYASLPKLRRYRDSYSDLGFDPIDKQFKVFSIGYTSNEKKDHGILTLGTGEMRWRKIQYPFKPYSKGICINGVLYYSTVSTVYCRTSYDCRTSYGIVCFDVRSEKFKFVDTKRELFYDTKFINYKGKLGVIGWEYNVNTFELWVLEDVEKQEWSKNVYTLGEKAPVDPSNHFIVGVTATGEIVLSQKNTSERFYVFYFSPERNTLQRVEIQGVENHRQVNAFVDLVEDLNVTDAKQLKSSKSLYIIRTRPKPEKRHTSRDLCNSVENKKSTTILQNKYELLASLE